MQTKFCILHVIRTRDLELQVDESAVWADLLSHQAQKGQALLSPNGFPTCDATPTLISFWQCSSRPTGAGRIDGQFRHEMQEKTRDDKTPRK